MEKRSEVIRAYVQPSQYLQWHWAAHRECLSLSDLVVKALSEYMENHNVQRLRTLREIEGQLALEELLDHSPVETVGGV